MPAKEIKAKFWFQRIVVYPRSQVVSLYKKEFDGSISRYELDRTCLELPDTVVKVKKPTRLDEIEVTVIGIEAIKVVRQPGGY